MAIKEKEVIKVGSRIRITKDLQMFNITYLTGHEFNVISQSYRGFDLKEDEGRIVLETALAQDTFELVKEYPNE